MLHESNPRGRSDRWGRTLAKAVTGAALLVLVACTTSAPPSEDGTPAEGGDVITVTDTGELCSLNKNSAGCSLVTNNNVFYLTQGQFFRIDNEGEIVYDESFGTVEVLSEDPLTVKYTVNEGVVWSDGVQVGADDLILETLARTGYYDDQTEDESAGTTYFNHSESPAGMRLAGFPEVGDDGRSMTITYETPFAGWALFNPTGVPAHVVAEQTGVAEPGEDFISLLGSIPQGDPAAPAAADNAQLRSVADFWSNGFEVTSLPDDPSIYVSSGPYVIEDWSTGQSVTLKRSETYTGDLVPAFERMVVRFIPDSAAQVQALKNGEVDVIVPEASPDTLVGLEGIPDAEVMTGTSSSWDHMQLNLATAAFEDPTVREAFLKTIPREQIMDAIIRPLDPEANPLDSYMFLPGTPGYDEAAAANGSSEFADVDIEGARELLAGRTPTVRIAYNAGNPNRLDSFLAIQASAQEAGFIVEDGGLPAATWVQALPEAESWDAFIWGTNTVTLDVERLPQYFLSTAERNYGGWNNPQADSLIHELINTVDQDEQQRLMVEVDQLVWQDRFGLPLFNEVGIQAYNSTRVSGLEYCSWQPWALWNFWEWEPVS